MNLKRFLKIFIIINALIVAHFSYAVSPFNPLTTTPTVYEITITRIEFITNTGVTNVLVNNEFSLDIASVAAQQKIASVAQGAKLPAGAYTSVRLIVKSPITMYGMVLYHAQETVCHTHPDNEAIPLANLSDPNYTLVGVASASIGNEIQVVGNQRIPIPQGKPIDTGPPDNGEFAANSVTRLGNDEFAVVSSVNFVVLEEGPMPSIQINFNTEDSLEFLLYAPGDEDLVCFARPKNSPSINVVVN